jgi:hypothetical protein
LSDARESGPTRPEADLTIITVCIEKHFDYVRQQVRLIEELNPRVAWRMLVVDNSASDVPLKLKDERCQVVKGVAPDLNLPANFRGSYHHAAALNMAVRRVATRYCFLLDPDLFVLYRNWITEAIEHMRRHGLALFGTPWHYRWYNKYRYYPCVHALLIDLAMIPAEKLDFTPAIAEDEKRRDSPLRRVLNRIPLLPIRLRISSSRDTGWRLYAEQRRRGRFRAGVVLPVVNIEKEMRKPKHLTTSRGRWIERRLPRRWSLLPAPGTYIEPGQAPAFQRATISALEAETFVWRGAPFAFHLRRHVRDTVDRRGDESVEKVLLKPFLKRVGASGSWAEWTTDHNA